MSVNKVILVGNVGKDPEIRHLDTGVAVANFPLATSETYTAKNGEKVTTTEWHNIVLWRGLAEVAEKYVTKGRQLYIEGRIRTRNYDDKDGNKRYITEIYGDTMQMLGTKADDKSGATHYNQNQSTPGAIPPVAMASEPAMDEPGGDEDLPF
jgi:single-strand DNA-binding protein